MKFSEMIALRTDLALSLEAGFDNYLEDISGGYGEYLSPVIAEGETALDARYQMVLLRRSIERQRQRLEKPEEGVVTQTHDDEKVRAEVNQGRDALDAKLRLVRSTCRGIYGPRSVDRVGLKGSLPQGTARLLRFGLTVKANLENPALDLKPLLELEIGSGEAPSAPAHIATQLEPELSRLAALVASRHQERRKTVGVRLKRQEIIREFDDTIRGIVRLAQGMSRLAGRDDLGARFRPILRRALRRLKGQKVDDSTEPKVDVDIEADPAGGSTEGEATQPPTDPTSEAPTA